MVLVVRDELPDGHPGRAEYQEFLVERGEEWIAQAVAALADGGVTARPTVLVGESFAESLIDFAEEQDSDLIVIGGARDGSSAATSSVRSPARCCTARRSRWRWRRAATPRTRRRHGHRGHRRGAHPTRRRQPAAVRLTLASAGGLADPDGVAGVGENLAEADNIVEAAPAQQIAAAEENLAVAARALPDAPDIESLVADGLTLESALKKLNWNDTDVLVVGSSRFAAPSESSWGPPQRVSWRAPPHR